MRVRDAKSRSHRTANEDVGKQTCDRKLQEERSPPSRDLKLAEIRTILGPLKGGSQIP